MPNLLGLTKTDQLFLDTVWDLLVLMSVFYHKSCLETAGMILYLDNEDFFNYYHLQNMTINLSLTTHGKVIKDRLEGSFNSLTKSLL